MITGPLAVRPVNCNGSAALPGFTTHTLAAFDDERIKQFVQAWYSAQCTCTGHSGCPTRCRS